MAAKAMGIGSQGLQFWLITYKPNVNMPKNEYDSRDPQELVRIPLPDGDEDMIVKSFIETFVRVGSSDEEIWELFKDPLYTTTNRIYRTSRN